VSERPASVGEVKELIDRHDIEFIFAQFVEVTGKPCAKLIPAAYVDDLFSVGAGFAGFAAGEIGQGPHSPDLEAIPDPRSFTLVPWHPGLARLACDIRVEGQEWPYCPRTILRNQLARAKAMGFEFKVGFEAEFMLLRFDEDGRLQLADPLDTAHKPCYDMKGLTRQFEFISTLSKYVNELGWGNYANDHEDANSQFETNVTFSDALTSADRAVFFRYMVHSLAEKHGMIASFMPKPFTDKTGNGFHLHMSLWDAETDTNLFEDTGDPKGLGLSSLAYHFIGGLLRHANGYAAFAAPTPNSYKRLIPGTEQVRTWVPVYITYGGNNRTQMLRVPAPGRVEDRTADGACNPYLAMTAALAAGLDGIERKTDPGERNDGNLYELDSASLAERGIDLLPANLVEATNHLVRDDVLRLAFGKVDGEDFVDYYARLKRAEHRAIHDRVTDWEIERYLLYP
jgi:glutamine synthetase